MAETCSPSASDRPRPGANHDHGPLVVKTYQKRLIERISALVPTKGSTVDKDLIREVAILADRSDICEEIVRLRAHLCSVRGPPRPRERRRSSNSLPGMGREVNTIGSKAGDVEISRTSLRSRGFWKRFGARSKMSSDCEAVRAAG